MKNLLLLILFSSPLFLFSQPSNDDCSNAIALEPASLVNLTTSFSVTNANVENEEGCAGSALSNYVDIWYTIDMPVDGNLYINGKSSKNRFQLFDTCNGTELDCFSSSKLVEDLTSNTTYTLRLYRTSPTDGFNLNFDVFVYPTAVNDDCNNAIELDPMVGSSLDTSFEFMGASYENENGCDANDQANWLDIWYDVTIPAEADMGNLRINGNSNRNKFELLDACDGTPLACFSAGGLIENLPAGDYKLRLFRTTLDRFNLSFGLRVYPPATNDDCVDAIELDPVAGSTLTTPFEFHGADWENEVGCPGDDPTNWLDIWYDVTMPVEGNLWINGKSTRNKFELLDACDGTVIDCFSGSKLVQNVTTGDYKLRLYRNVLDRFNLDFDLRVYPSALNDDCADAIDLDPVIGSTLTTNFEFMGADFEDEKGCDFDTNTANWLDIWYNVTIPAEADMGNLRITGNSTRNKFELLDACDGTPVDCFSAGGLIENLPAGDYKLRLFRNTLDRFNLSFGLRVYQPAPNDDCENATELDPVVGSTLNTNFTVLGADFETEIGCTVESNWLDIWYDVTIPAEADMGNLWINGKSSRNNFQLLDACDGTVIECFTTSKLVQNLPAGDYKLRLFRNNLDLFNQDFDLRVYPPAVNDDCEDAILLEPVPLVNLDTNFEFWGADFEDEVGCSGENTANRLDIWYTIDMPYDGDLLIDGFNNRNRFELFDACDGSSIACFTNDQLIEDLPEGQYKLRLHRTTLDRFNLTFRLRVTPYPVSSASAGSCVGAPTTIPDITIDATNNNEWVLIKDDIGDVVAAINANGNNLGLVTTSLFIDDIEDYLTYNLPSGDPIYYLRRYHEINVQNQPSTPVDVRLYYELDEFNDLNTIDETIDTEDDFVFLKVADFDCATPYDGTIGETIIPTISTYTPSERSAEFQVDSFSTFFGMSADNAQILPVKLESFTAQAFGQNVQLNWVTASEINNSGFEIQRSNDGINWSNIGWVDGLGSTNDRTTYEFIDHQPISGAQFYRLKQVDFNGDFEFSDVVSVQITTSAEVFIYPNPAVNEISISRIDEHIKQITILDTNGKIVYLSDRVLNEQIIDISELGKGLYFVEVQTEEEIEIIKFVKY